MEWPKVIIVATDFSECAQATVRYATKLAKNGDARVFLLHAWQPPLLGTGAEMTVMLTQEVFSQIEGTASARLQEALAQAQAELPEVQSLLVQGDPRDVIVRAVAELKADLVVVGTHGRRWLPRLLLGSVAEYVVRHPPCTVLTVRATDEARSAAAAA